jgi:DNA-binding NtrC family response regulator
MDTERGNVLIVDDEKNFCAVLKETFEDFGWLAETCGSIKEGIEKLRSGDYDVVITDLKLPDGRGEDFLKIVKESNPDIEVIVLTAYGTVESAVEAMKSGAFDYILKGGKVCIDELKITAVKALERKRLREENRRLWREVSREFSFENIVGRSKAMQDIFDLIRRVAGVDTPVLIEGESGTGKELVARAIHHNSLRKGKPFVAINCASIPETLVESELFGHVKGAFTGAYTSKKGLFEVADGGTVFLDEIGDLPLNTQAKILRFLQEKTFQPVGSTEEKRVDVRIICATNKSLKEEMLNGRFREDLFYRINVITIKLPPLRERKEDIPLLVRHFVEKFSKELKKEIKGVSDEAMEMLINYSYPGNVRELENIIIGAITLETSDIIQPETLLLLKKNRGPATDITLEPLSNGFNLEKVIGEMEKRYVKMALEKANGKQTRAAELLGITPRQLRYLMEKYGLK